MLTYSFLPVSTIPDDLKVRSNQRIVVRGNRTIPIGVGGRMDNVRTYNISHNAGASQYNATHNGVYRHREAPSSLGWQNLTMLDRTTQWRSHRAYFLLWSKGLHQDSFSGVTGFRVGSLSTFHLERNVCIRELQMIDVDESHWTVVYFILCTYIYF